MNSWSILTVICLGQLLCRTLLAESTRLIELERDLFYSSIETQGQLESFLKKFFGKDYLKLTSGNLSQASHLDQSWLNSTNQSWPVDELDRNLRRIFNLGIESACGRDRPSDKTQSKNFYFGLLSIVLIHSTSLFGAILLPFRYKSTFKWILTIFIGLAVGTLIGTGIFHLIPMSFAVDKNDFDLIFLNKGLLTILVIALFHARDQLSRIFLRPGVVDGETSDEKKFNEISNENEPTRKSLRLSLKQMKPIGWMLIIGDLLHGFIDGLTVGAISIVSLPELIQMVLPIGFEEFSHKLGDTAVLLTSGLSMKQSLIMNFLSSIGLYPGFILGVRLGLIDNLHPWICALAGGMFIYIGLTDMIPELISIGREIEHDYRLNKRTPANRRVQLGIILSQNLGILFGILLMFLLAKYGQDLFEFSSI